MFKAIEQKIANVYLRPNDKYVNMKIITVSGIYPPYKYVHAETNENRIPRKRYQI